MKINRLLILFFLLVPIAAFGQLRTSDLVDPAPISIPQGVSQSAANDAVINAMYARDWTVAEEGDDFIIADLYVRAHWAQIGIDIGEDEIKISYRDSEELRYTERRDGRVVIHNNYLAWIDNLVGDIRSQLARAQRDSR